MRRRVLIFANSLRFSRWNGPGLLWGLLLVGAFVAVQSGAVPIRGDDWLVPFKGAAASGPSGGEYVLWHLRLPRVAFAILAGACLGLSGALTQGLFRNPLADPGLLGVSAGAASFAALALVVFAGFGASFPWRIWFLPGAAFCGALSVCFILDRASRRLVPGSTPGLLLTGIALNALAASVIGLCTYLATEEQLRTLSFWTLGSLAGASWPLVGASTILTLGAWQWSRRLTSAMNALALGEAAAVHVGINLQRLRSVVIALVATTTGFIIAWCGMIGFIGLIAPHLVRLWLGPDLRRVVPLSMAMGGFLLLSADTLARTIAIPAEIPVGIFTALLGGPFFLLLLRGMNKGGG